MKLRFVDEKLNDDNSCGIRIWEKPKHLAVYAIGADVAEGIGKDASCAQVINCETGLVVANYWSNFIDADQYAAELYKLAHYYNKAWLNVEANNHGIAVISHLTGNLEGLAYPKLYKREVFDEFTRKKTQKVGFKTTQDSKARLIENVKAAVRDGDLKVLDKLTLKEMNDFVRDTKSGRYAAQGSARDDRVMALALAWEQARIVRARLEHQSDHEVPSQSYDSVTGFPI